MIFDIFNGEEEENNGDMTAVNQIASFPQFILPHIFLSGFY
jgi:hypothetical protein